MREVALFVEDYAHRQVIGALVERTAGDSNLGVRLDWRNAVGGHGKVVTELEDYMRNLLAQGGPFPDLVVVATDANCRGLNDRLQEIGVWDIPAPVILAVPDPHIERWLLLDGEATLCPLVVLVGPNAEGKSNLLDALLLLSKLGTIRTLREAFDPPYRRKPLESFTIGSRGRRGLLKQDRLARDQR